MDLHQEVVCDWERLIVGPRSFLVAAYLAVAQAHHDRAASRSRSSLVAVARCPCLCQVDLMVPVGKHQAYYSHLVPSEVVLALDCMIAWGLTSRLDYVLALVGRSMDLAFHLALDDHQMESIPYLQLS